MEEICLEVDTAALEFYRRIAEKTGRSPEQVMAELLFCLAGELALRAEKGKR